MKNKILKTITAIAGVVWIVTGCMLDSEKYLIPIITVNLVSFGWLVLFFKANKDYYIGEC